MALVGLIRHYVAGVAPVDLRIAGAVSGTLVAAALAALHWPARWASALEPSVTLPASRSGRN